MCYICIMNHFLMSSVLNVSHAMELSDQLMIELKFCVRLIPLHIMKANGGKDMSIPLSLQMEI